MKRQKKGLQQEGPDQTYFSSTWILNFGVVPLLRLATFLFCPIFVFLRSLRFSVTRVLDTIALLLTSAIKQSLPTFRPATLSLVAQAVKGFTLVLLLNPTTLWAEFAEGPILLAIGEHRKISNLQIDNFINGNREVVGAHYDEQRQELILRGAMMGYSQLIIHHQAGHSTQLNIYVLSKRQHLELYQLTDSFTGIGLKVNPLGLSLEVTGTLKDRASYLRFHQLKKEHGHQLQVNIELSPKLIHELSEQVYLRFYEQFIDTIQCQPREDQLECLYDQDSTIEDSLHSLVTKEWFVNLRARPNPKGMANYRIRLKLIQLEQSDGRELSIGLDGLNLHWSDLFHRSFRSILEENRLLLKDQRVNLSTLAEPEAMVQLNSEVNLKVGAEIPYTTTQPTTGANETQWKFAGLEVQAQLSKNNNHYQISYQTGFTRPDGESVSGNRESSTVYIALGQALPLFTIHYQSIGQQDSGFPYIRNIPLLGALFGSSSKTKTYKNLTGVLILERINL